MKFVQPIRDPDVIEAIKQYLKKTNNRNYIMFCIGIYTGLRISDILNLRVSDVMKERIFVKEIKTRKENKVPVNPELRKILDGYIKGKEPYEYLLPSRKGTNRPIKREQAYRILRSVARRFGLESIGTHTLRKTFGYHFHKMNNNTELLRVIFNHTDVTITRRYIGIEQDTIDEAIFKLRY
ncbi:site-specific integrase [Paenibacillus sp. KR2-11]|uniref:site-specific integrase n=1 Tax=Paenibacillus sp. KR2-11 TaxID=3385500 RepID=UPI0038FBEC60